FFVSCSKEKLVPGPKGATGAKGDKGEQGEQGKSGIPEGTISPKELAKDYLIGTWTVEQAPDKDKYQTYAFSTASGDRDYSGTLKKNGQTNSTDNPEEEKTFALITENGRTHFKTWNSVGNPANGINKYYDVKFEQKDGNFTLTLKHAADDDEGKIVLKRNANIVDDLTGAKNGWKNLGTDKTATTDDTLITFKSDTGFSTTKGGNPSTTDGVYQILKDGAGADAKPTNKIKVTTADA
ncbi:hypothetical protein ElyMa_002539300, partial [Elysia marginata]